MVKMEPFIDIESVDFCYYLGYLERTYLPWFLHLSKVRQHPRKSPG